MASEQIYIISNASMHIFPKNTRAKFSNMLAKEIYPRQQGQNSLWFSLENIIMKNTLIHYESDPNIPDI